MELMKEAGLNTLLGMGTTFVVLIALSLIISLFGKILSGGFKKAAAPAKAEAPKTPETESTRAARALTKGAQEASAGPAGTDPAQDPELMAVIAAAVAAYESDEIPPEIAAVIAAAVAAAEGKAGVSGFEARKIKKTRRRAA